MKKQYILGLFSLFTAILRFIPGMNNFSSIYSLGAVSGAKSKFAWQGWIYPVAALWVSDLVLNNVIYGAYFDSFQFFSQPFLWAAFALLLIVFVSKLIMKNKSMKNVFATAISAPIIFYIISNFGSWTTSPLYTKDLFGLFQCYGAGVPFLIRSLAASLVFTPAMFMAYDYLMASEKDLAEVKG